MKTLTITLLTFISLSSHAMLHNGNMLYFLPASYTNDLSQDNDTTKIRIANSEITIVDNDTTVNVQVFDKEDNNNNNSSFEEFKDVNVEVIEGANSTRIIVVKDGDTIKNYEMNYDFQAEGDLKKLDFTDHRLKNNEANRKIENENKSFTFSKKKNNRFKGHWAGFEMGLNNYVTDDFSMTPDEPYMEINTGKSWNFNFNFAQFSIPIVRDRFGLVSGLGLEWNNYHFSKQNSIYKNPLTQKIDRYELTNVALKKNRLQTTYLTAPLLMEIQLGNSNRDKQISLSGGLIAGLKLGSHTKYKTSNDKQKNKDDFYLQSFRYGYTARINYNDFGFYFTYYNTPLFLNGKGPELHPFAAGLVLSFN